MSSDSTTSHIIASKPHEQRCLSEHNHHWCVFCYFVTNERNSTHKLFISYRRNTSTVWQSWTRYTFPLGEIGILLDRWTKKLDRVKNSHKSNAFGRAIDCKTRVYFAFKIWLNYSTVIISHSIFTLVRAIDPFWQFSCSSYLATNDSKMAAEKENDLTCRQSFISQDSNGESSLVPSLHGSCSRESNSLPANNPQISWRWRGGKGAINELNIKAFWFIFITCKNFFTSLCFRRIIKFSFDEQLSNAAA